ncbi:MAG: Rieske 2Fe-2S domain-containing protein [Dehalococcoidia bacterium]|nr:Rieske 2Fe-2S domain-containing protein [Dehalococcoidia bacterium]
MALVTVARKGDIARGKMIGVEVEGKKLIIASFAGNLYAMDAVCSHMGGDLSKGRFESDVVICPRHGAQYDVRTGKLVRDVGFAAKALTVGRGAHDQTTYPVVIEGDEVKVDI